MTLKLQFGAAIIIAAQVITYGMLEVVGIAYLVTFLVLLIVIGLLGWFLWRHPSHRRANLDTKRMEQAITEIKSLSFEEARETAYKLLADTSKFKCIRASTGLQMQHRLSASLQEFFSAYESVKAIAGEAQLSRSLIGSSEYLKGFMRIGTNLDFTEIAVHPNEDHIYEIDGSEVSEEDFKASQLPSIYHWVLVIDEVLYGSNAVGAS